MLQPSKLGEATMGQSCDFCGEQRSMVYCRSDAACLCLSCDRIVHSANALSRRHLRTLLCDGCHSQPAAVRLIEAKLSLCQDCDDHRLVPTLGSKRQMIDCYSGCPSASELSKIWSFVLEIPPIDGTHCTQGLGLMCINENSAEEFWDASDCSRTVEVAVSSNTNDVPNVAVFNSWSNSSLQLGLHPFPSTEDQPAGSVDSTSPKLFDRGTNGLGMYETDECFEDFSVDDVDLNFNDYDGLFGVSQSYSKQHFDDAETDSLFGIENISAFSVNLQEGNPAKASSAWQVTETQPACSDAVFADSVISNPETKSTNLCFPTRETCSSLSFSFYGVTGENGAEEYQDCGMSTMFLMGEPPWYPPGLGNSAFTSTCRDSAIMRYKEKKKTRKFEKKIRYASRKARADVRRRVRGRFVKASDAYDYNPLCYERSF